MKLIDQANSFSAASPVRRQGKRVAETTDAAIRADAAHGFAQRRDPCEWPGWAERHFTPLDVIAQYDVIFAHAADELIIELRRETRGDVDEMLIGPVSRSGDRRASQALRFADAAQLGARGGDVRI